MSSIVGATRLGALFSMDHCSFADSIIRRLLRHGFEALALRAFAKFTTRITPRIKQTEINNAVANLFITSALFNFLISYPTTIRFGRTKLMPQPAWRYDTDLQLPEMAVVDEPVAGVDLFGGAQTRGR